MLTILCYDVEDLVTEESDDAALWCAEILREEGLTGSFFVVGEKARLWEQRGRRDVIEALKGHDIGFHSTWHSVHPTTSEICLDKSFRQGIEALWEWDAPGWSETERIFGRPLNSWARSGGSWAPSVHGLMGRMGRCYMYAPDFLGDHNIAWYANCLSFSGFMGGFDAVYCDDQQFESALARFKVEATRRLEHWQYFGLFVGHPTRVISKEFWDVCNFAKGANPPRDQWRAQEMHPADLIPTMQKNYRRLMRDIKDNGQFEVVGLSDLARRYDYQEPFVPHRYLTGFCGKVSKEERILFTDEFTAAELLTAMVEAAADPRESYVRKAVYGPETMPPVSPVTKFDPKALRSAAVAVSSHIWETRFLPASVEVSGSTIGLGTYFIALAKALAGEEAVTAPADAHYPDVATNLDREIREMLPSWPIHPDDMDLDNLCEQASLQCWALKPAFARQSDRMQDFRARYRE
ncbi:MAG: hypothetical protein HY318_00890 [Armatimonadetes bacterium]|nr:hypothetical protein [Armatimonadota bacterium]